jgi:hypothetical protein
MSVTGTLLPIAKANSQLDKAQFIAHSAHYADANAPYTLASKEADIADETIGNSTGCTDGIPAVF